MINRTNSMYYVPGSQVEQKCPSYVKNNLMLRLPSSYHFLPHLLDDQNSLRLAYLMSRNRNGVSMVMGVPTVRREKQSYLMDTLQNLIDGMTTQEADDALIVVFIGEVSFNVFFFNFL
ncbi:unnamed protein product [Acanthoscelides obtectus]|uniref:MGAT4 conserved region domain-containing protein n=1 Tax=Acanthoscelides obtectus TaxID=200917 RepID=A0A9P0LB45_ACAOB|nr:unnamed protein product [Acanthoscelides obtectus]CAK1645814.1 Alpha-1,3-mannosyl-glycoprotein 4-beta-N-acetylglucosaminyltransferase A [Acanthoscelides obtectus]